MRTRLAGVITWKKEGQGIYSVSAKESAELPLLGEYVLKNSLLKCSYGLKTICWHFDLARKRGGAHRKMASYENNSRNVQFLSFSYTVDHAL